MEEKEIIIVFISFQSSVFVILSEVESGANLHKVYTESLDSRICI